MKGIDAERRLMSVTVPSLQMTAADVPVLKDAPVIIGGKASKLADLKAGMSVTLQMCAESEKSLIVGVDAKNTAPKP
jgi:hypothetical protein